MISKDWTDFHTFYGSRGTQGNHNFYVITLKLREVRETFQYYLDLADDNPDMHVIIGPSGKNRYVPLRNASASRDIQRLRNPKKVDELIEYMRTCKSRWIFSSLTASCDENIFFEPFENCGGRVGAIRFKKGTKLLINDGQHRADAIGQIWNSKLFGKDTRIFGEQSISVVIFAGQDLARMQQMFVDLQKGTAVNKALAHELSSEREDMLVKQVRDAVPLFKNYIVSDQTSVARGSKKLFTLKVFFDANRYVFGSKLDENNPDAYAEFLIEFWDAVVANMPCWAPFATEAHLDTDGFRRISLSHLSVTLHALGMIASRIYHQRTTKSLGRLKKLRSVNWSRSSNKALFRNYTTSANKMANSKEVRAAVRDYLWTVVLEYKN